MLKKWEYMRDEYWNIITYEDEQKNKISIQKMIDKIQKIIWDKTPNFWCIVQWVHPNKIIEYKDWDYIVYDTIDKKQRIYDEMFIRDRIIGHSVMIWDILEWLCLPKINNNRIWWQSTLANILNIWDNKKKPIEEQSEDCIKYIYYLLP